MMKNAQKIALCSLLSIFSQILSDSGYNEQFQPYSTDKFSYVVMQTNRPMKPYDIQLQQPILISDKTQKNYFNTGIVRIRVTEITQGTLIITTSEIWQTKNPSYITWTNAALISAIIGTIIYQTYLERSQQVIKLFEGDARYFNGKSPQAIGNDEKEAMDVAIKQGFISEKNAAILWDNEVMRAEFLQELRSQNYGSPAYQKETFFDKKWYQKKWNTYLQKDTEYQVKEIEFDFTNKQI